jgi:hypothetical protein
VFPVLRDTFTRAHIRAGAHALRAAAALFVFVLAKRAVPVLPKAAADARAWEAAACKLVDGVLVRRVRWRGARTRALMSVCLCLLRRTITTTRNAVCVCVVSRARRC